MTSTTPDAMLPSPNLAPPYQLVVLDSDPMTVRQLQDRIEGVLRERHASDHDVFGVRLAIEEAVVNAMRHGNQLDPTKKVHVQYRFLPHSFEIEVRDEGPGFDPQDVPDPTAIENLERPCGRGLMLMRHYMTEVHYNARGNTVSMSKVLRNGHN